MNPTLAGFVTFAQAAGVVPAVLDPASPFFAMSFAAALEIVNPLMQAVTPTLYALAVYNLAMSILVATAPDVTGSTFFADLRRSLNLNSLLPGVVTSASDQGTSASLATPDFYKNLSLADLQLIRDPWGRAYLALAMRLGSNWGLN